MNSRTTHSEKKLSCVLQTESRPTRSFTLVLSLLLYSAYPQGAEPDNQSSGRALYQEHCATCHEAGIPKAPSASMLKHMVPGTIYSALDNGAMIQQARHLTDDEKILIAETLTGQKLSKSASPKPPVCLHTPSLNQDGLTQPTGWGFDLRNQRVLNTEQAGIHKGNVKTLELAWALAFPDAARARSHPAVAGNVVFVGSQSGRVYALDQKTGCTHWTYDAGAEVRTAIVLDPEHRGAANEPRLLYFGDFTGNVYALNALSGELVWKKLADSHQNATITGSPSYHEGVLYVPVSSLEVTAAVSPDYACCTFRGSVVAYDATTGEQIWKTYTIKEQPSPTRKNRAGTINYGPSGAPIWSAPTIDPVRGQLYVGTGENYSSPAGNTSDAILAIELETGRIRWVFQATKGDAWNSACVAGSGENCPEEDGPDFDFGSSPILASTKEGRELVIAGQKSGIVWAIDPESGERVWKNQVGRGGIIGGIHFGMAVSNYSVIVPISDSFANPDYPDRYQGQPRPGLYSLNMEDGTFNWAWSAPSDTCQDIPLCKPGLSAAPTATSELVVSGSLDGWVRIHDIHDGDILWEFNTARQFKYTTNGITGHGGALSGSASAILNNGMMFLNSGYMFSSHMPGNVFIAFRAKQ